MDCRHLSGLVKLAEKAFGPASCLMSSDLNLCNPDFFIEDQVPILDANSHWLWGHQLRISDRVCIVFAILADPHRSFYPARNLDPEKSDKAIDKGLDRMTALRLCRYIASTAPKGCAPRHGELRRTRIF